MKLKVAAITAGLLIALAGLWNAGEMHRRNCITQNRVGCSVLPWQAGHYPVASQPGPESEMQCILAESRKTPRQQAADARAGRICRSR